MAITVDVSRLVVGENERVLVMRRRCYQLGTETRELAKTITEVGLHLELDAVGTDDMVAFYAVRRGLTYDKIEQKTPPTTATKPASATPPGPAKAKRA